MVGKAQCDEDQRFFLLTYSIDNGRRTSIKTVHVKTHKNKAGQIHVVSVGSLCVCVCLYVCVCVVVRTLILNYVGCGLT